MYEYRHFHPPGTENFLLDESQHYEANSAKRRAGDAREQSHEAKVSFHSDPGTSIDLYLCFFFYGMRGDLRR